MVCFKVLKGFLYNYKNELNDVPSKASPKMINGFKNATTKTFKH